MHMQGTPLSFPPWKEARFNEMKSASINTCGLWIVGRERPRGKRKDLHSKGTVNRRIGRKVQNNHREGRKI